ncbi:MAG: hypothetical protein PVI23_11185 [Maricaulaceae bacterium]|jgi:hypothetical protein
MDFVTFLYLSAPALLVVAVLTAVMFRGLTRSTWMGFVLRLWAGAAVLFALCVAAMFAMKPWVEAAIAECLAEGGSFCEDDGLAIIIPIYPTVYGLGYWIVAALVVRAATIGGRRADLSAKGA